MSDENEPKEEYTPPKAAWDLREFIKASEAELAAKTVTCNTCPVFMLCEAGEGSSGYWCPKCGNIGVYVNEEDMAETGIPREILLIDCNKHKFPREPKRKLTICSVCSGGIMDLLSRGIGANNHYIYTEHCPVPVKDRQKKLREEYEHHCAEYARQKKAKESDD